MTHKIIAIERSKTKNGAPMWRCLTDDGERVNVFTHKRLDRDQLRLFRSARYSQSLTAMNDGDVLYWETHPINVEMVRDGDWWKVVAVTERPVGAAPDEDMPSRPKHAPEIAITWAKWVLDTGFVVLDTETTGLGDDDEICQIAVVNHHGNVLMHRLIRPQRVERLTGDIHGITAEAVADAPAFAACRAEIERILELYPIRIAYNASFDQRMLNAEFVRLGQDAPLIQMQCAMRAYAGYKGEWDALRRQWAFISLSDACEQMGIQVEGAHDAAADCHMTLALIREIAAGRQPKALQSEPAD